MKWLVNLLVSIFTLDFSRREAKLEKLEKKEITEVLEDEIEQDPTTSSKTFKIIVCVIFVLSIVVGFAGTAVINNGIYDHYIKQRESYKAKPDPNKDDSPKIKSVLDIKD